MKNIFLTSILISSLGSITAIAADKTNEVLEKVKTINTMYCNDMNEFTVEKHVNSYKYNSDEPTAPAREVTFYIATCIAGAYNSNSAVFRDDPYDGLQSVAFPAPLVNEKNKIIGWTASMSTGGIYYDEKEKSLVSFFKGRGVGDAFTSATYVFHQDELLLRKYEMDNTYDGKINPKTIFVSKIPLK